MKVLFSAAEASADLHAAHVVAAIRKQVPDLQLMGIGGKHLEGEGLLPVARAADLAVMGSIEILSRLPKIRRAGRDLLAAARELRPDVAVLVDYPGFHFRIGPKLKELGIPVVYFIPPKVWVWRRSRLQIMKTWVARVLCILPFEPKIYQSEGIPAEFVGSPLVEELPIGLSREQARVQLGVPADSSVLALLPGSRLSEMKRHWLPFLEAAKEFTMRAGGRWTVLIPIAPTLDLEHWRAELQLFQQGVPESFEIRLVTGDSGLVLRAASLGLIKSGTSTLEAGVLECPMVVAYRPGGLTSWAVKHVIRYQGPVGLVNLFQGWKPGDEPIVPEVLHDQMTAPRLVQALESIYLDGERLEKMRRDLRGLRDLMISASSGALLPSERAAASVLEVARGEISR